MKEYPKRPFLISGHRYEQLWLVLPLCFIAIFARGCGIIGAICIFLMWFFYSIAMSEQEWRKSCDNGVASIYSSKKYLESQGFREQFSIGTEKIERVMITKEVIDEINKYIENNKRKMEEVLIDYCTYKKMVDSFEKNKDDDAKVYLCNISKQLLDKTYKYMPEREMEKLYKDIFYDNDKLYPGLKNSEEYIAIYHFIHMDMYFQIEILNMYKTIMKALYGECKYLYTISSYETLYDKLTKGEDIYDNPYK